MNNRKEIISKYMQDVKRAQSELAKKELLITLLVRLFDGDNECKQVLDNFNLGAEKTVFNIPLRNRTKTGIADTQYNNVIIEFEKDLKKTGNHAVEQLVEYLSGNWKTGEDYNFELIATDGISWKIYYPEIDFSKYVKKLFTVSDVRLKLKEQFYLTESNADDFFFFLDRCLFKTVKQKATLKNIKDGFGELSQVYINTIQSFLEYLPDLNKETSVSTAYDQWKKFLVVAYGKFTSSQELFFIHSYLSVFSKLIAYRIISDEEIVNSGDIKNILNGSIFNKYHVQRFVDDDFYSWISQEKNIKKLLPTIRGISSKLSEYDFKNVNEDILKGVYQELIDIETRHSLGEYYTPDWLCERIVDEIPLKQNSSVLDPACGSGSFLRATINAFRKKFPRVTIENILNQVVGIDIHPLSVQISKTTVLITLGDTIQQLSKPIVLNVHLANSLRLPFGSAELFGETFEITIDKKRFPMDNSIFNNPSDFDESIELCNSIAEYEDSIINETQFFKQLRNVLKNSSENHQENFYRIYKALKTAKQEQRDTIWKFILQNLYKPALLRQHFDFVVGNPPWLTYSDITESSYQAELLELSNRYRLIPWSKANMPHLEIASIFMAHSCNYFLKPSGKIAFVLPRSFFTADQHDNTRSGSVRMLKIDSAWDLEKVTPLFRVPACVLFGSVGHDSLASKNCIPEAGVPGIQFRAKLPDNNLNWHSAKAFVKELPVRYYYSTLSGGKYSKSALTTERINNKHRESYYASKFKQGATIVPRNFFFIDIEQELNSNEKDRLIQCKSLVLPEAKKPWIELTISGRLKTKFIFRTALSKNVIPYAIVNPLLVTLPISILPESISERIVIKTADQLFSSGEGDMAKWFKKAERLWNEHKTDRNKDSSVSLYDYVNWQSKLTSQDLNSRFIVLYTASAKDANAALLDRNTVDLPFVVESKTYWFGTNNKHEAYYLVGILNSQIVNIAIKEFQSRGLFGPRDVHKSVLGLPIPKYDISKKHHVDLANASELLSNNISTLIHRELDLVGAKLGIYRVGIKKTFANEFKNIDKLVLSILKK